MVTIDRIPYNYSVYYYEGEAKWHGKCNKCGGTDATSSATLKTVVDQCISLLGSNGGSIFIKDGQLPNDTNWGSYPSKILIVESYQGKLTYYRDSSTLFELGDLAIPL